MQFDVPDPRYTASTRSARNFVLAAKLAVGLLVVVWSVFAFDQLTGIGLIRLGLIPRETQGLLGLVTTPLLHYDLGHIGSNSLPLLVGGTMMLFLYPNSSARALPMIWLGSGLLAWLFARPNVHIGASGLIYGILAFVFVSGLVRRDLRSIGAALLVWFLYGSMLWGVLPTVPKMSWELHISGLAVGVFTAIRFRRIDWPPMKRYAWEDEDADPDDDPEPWRSRSQSQSQSQSQFEKR